MAQRVRRWHGTVGGSEGDVARAGGFEADGGVGIGPGVGGAVAAEGDADGRAGANGDVGRVVHRRAVEGDLERDRVAGAGEAVVGELRRDGDGGRLRPRHLGTDVVDMARAGRWQANSGVIVGPARISCAPRD